MDMLNMEYRFFVSSTKCIKKGKCGVVFLEDEPNPILFHGEELN
jgi:hypothetical protein